MEEKANAAVANNSEHSPALKPAQPVHAEKVADLEDLASEEEEQRNWRGICIALLVIATVLSLIITSVVLLSPGPEEPRVKNPRFNLQEVITGEFEPRLFNGSWISNTEVTFRDQDGAVALYNVQSREKTIIVANITVKQLNIRTYSISPDRKYVLLSYEHEQVFKHSFTAKYKIYVVETEQMQPFLPDMPNAVFQYVTWGNKGSQMAYVYRNNVYHIESYEASVKPRSLTQSGEEGVIFNGIPDWLYEAEVLGSGHALWWSTSGSKLCYATFNDSLVDVMTYPWYGSYEDSTNVYPQTITLRYPKPGRPNPRVTLWVTDFGQPFPVTEEVTPPPDIKEQEYYLTAVQWIDDSRLMSVWMKRAQNYSLLSICAAENGWMCRKHMQEETSYGWVDLHEKPVFSSDSKFYFMRCPVADGKAGRFRHVAEFDMASGRKDYLTHGSYDVTRIAAHLQEEHLVFYLSVPAGSATQRHLYTVADLTSVSPRDQQCLTCDLDEECLYHEAHFSPDSRHFVLECLGPGIPRVEIRSSLDNQLVEILDNNTDLEEALDNRARPQIQTFQVPLKGGYEANVRLYLPPPLRENEIIKYPLVLHVCGAPGTQLVTDRFQVHWGSYLASHKDFIYAYVDGRGSGFQGDKRTQEVFRRLGSLEADDQLVVASYLVTTLQYIDSERIAIWGWSYGGYTAVSVLATQSDVFTCGISVAPVTNWLYYDSVYSERYMQSPKPEDNYIGYEKADVAIRAENIRGKKFLLIHGTADDDVHLQHSMMLIKALTNAGVLFRTQIYPDERHSLVNVKTHLYQTMEDFLDFTCFKSPENAVDSHQKR